MERVSMNSLEWDVKALFDEALWKGIYPYLDFKADFMTDKEIARLLKEPGFAKSNSES